MERSLWSKKNHELSIDFGKKLRAIRLKRGLLQVDVAVMTGLRSQYISRIETGKARINMRLAGKICRGLKVHSSELLSF